MRLIGRIIWVAVAFAIAGLVAAGVAGIIGLERVTNEVVTSGGTDHADIDRWFNIFDQATKSLALLGGLSLLAPLVLVIAGEVMRIRSFIYYLVGGGLALAAAPAIGTGGIEAIRTGALPVILIQTLAVAGFAAGLVYWLLAGRKA